MQGRRTFISNFCDFPWVKQGLMEVLMCSIFRRKTVLIFLPFILSIGCSKEKDTVETPKGTLSIDVAYAVDGSPLLLDTLLYVDDVAGYAYKVNDVEYYLSDIKLIRSDSSEISVRNYQFMKAGRAGGSHFTISGIDTGSYCGISFNIGLTPLLNTLNFITFLLLFIFYCNY